ncbi:hypothetical protein LINGRAHAP2_LOCUS35455, partial [Linum grandiflorum]
SFSVISLNSDQILAYLLPYINHPSLPFQLFPTFIPSTFTHIQKHKQNSNTLVISTHTKMSSAQTKKLWLKRFFTALRTVVACMIVGATVLYGPHQVHKLVAFPAFSYVTTVLIVFASDASLGQVVKGCFCALYATVQVVATSALTLWLVGPERFARSSEGAAAAAVAVTAFVVAVPRSTPLLAKRIAFSQIVIVYVATVVHGEEIGRDGVLMDPVRVAASTGLGAVASVLAVLLPFPRLGYYEVKQTCKSYVENASERLDLLLQAFTAQDNQIASDKISQSKILSVKGAKHLQCITEIHGGMKWERLKSCIDPVASLKEVQTAIRGMELALSYVHSFPIAVMDDELKEESVKLRARMGLKLEQAKCLTRTDSATAPETAADHLSNGWQKIGTANQDDLPAFFFLYCMELLQGGMKIERVKNTVPEKTGILQKIWNDMALGLRRERWTFAVKCSLSLGLAVLLGLVFDKRNGYLSGLTIAISFVTKRQATFTAANARAQGTAMGSVYGILCCFLFHNLVDLRFLLLVPWIIFASFLKHSKMYGQPGAISAVIGALLILGRKDYGTPSEFAIARITEASIGLTCLLAVECLVQPARAATLARTQTAWVLAAMRDSIESVVLCTDRKQLPQRDTWNRVESYVNKLDQFIVEAEAEPNFWFLPFHSAGYAKLLGSLRNMSDLLQFISCQTEMFSHGAERLGLDSKKLGDINGDLDLFREKVGSTVKCLEEVISIKSLEDLKNMSQKQTSYDVELGKPPAGDNSTTLSPDEETVSDLVNCILQHTKELGDKIDASGAEEKLKSQMTLCLSALGFCISSLMREMADVEKEVKELIAWENPGTQVNLYDISCKVNRLHI